MTAPVDAGGDRLQMDTDGVTGIARALDGTAEALDGGWRAARSTIEAGEGGIGADRLGAAFRGAYQGARDAAQAAADPIPGRIRTDGALASRATGTYVDADARSAAGFSTGGAPRAR